MGADSPRVALWHRGLDIIVIVASAYLGTMLRQTEATLEATALLAKLHESEALRALALEAADIGAWDFDPDSGEITCDARCGALLGLRANAHYPDFLSIVHPADRAQVDAAVHRALDPDGWVFIRSNIGPATGRAATPRGSPRKAGRSSITAKRCGCAAWCVTRANANAPNCTANSW